MRFSCLKQHMNESKHFKNADKNISKGIFFTVLTCFREQLRAIGEFSSVFPRNGKPIKNFNH